MFKKVFACIFNGLPLHAVFPRLSENIRPLYLLDIKARREWRLSRWISHEQFDVHCPTAYKKHLRTTSYNSHCCHSKAPPLTSPYQGTGGTQHCKYSICMKDDHPSTTWAAFCNLLLVCAPPVMPLFMPAAPTFEQLRTYCK